jgi:hypothetical protein
MRVFRRGRIWWYNFEFQGRHVQESSGFTNKTAALRAEAKRKADRAGLDAGNLLKATASPRSTRPRASSRPCRSRISPPSSFPAFAAKIGGRNIAPSCTARLARRACACGRKRLTGKCGCAPAVAARTCPAPTSCIARRIAGNASIRKNTGYKNLAREETDGSLSTWCYVVVQLHG